MAGADVDPKTKWWKGTEGEVQTVRVDSRDTHGAYAVIEAVHEPGCAVPTHLHRNEEEHFHVLVGRYRIAIGDDIIDAPTGTRVTVPRNTPHSWRNVAPGEGRLLVVITPGGFEQLVYQVEGTPEREIPALAARYGCELLGPPRV
ncbi:cupin [Mycobacterium kubicae]|uniref:Cupin n=1 Tax=Mycobacterium kubicae TaxID=120959 RepID=A0AAX1J7N4_9MYCO|nr:cupin domain-containing protein [Mycobacterium kubicae]MCV7094709.1 cupin domain-containing protein [Mycobacterium kubicae]QNI13046.1 cupin domain-containing protein [Mycobacterium kubicae]QPI36562.1 cupin domain-containing protein [Mycobacterium kubicae]GFG67474.1 cupin [Mycobacterium kubicae]